MRMGQLLRSSGFHRWTGCPRWPAQMALLAGAPMGVMGLQTGGTAAGRGPGDRLRVACSAGKGVSNQAAAMPRLVCVGHGRTETSAWAQSRTTPGISVRSWRCCRRARLGGPSKHAMPSWQGGGSRARVARRQSSHAHHRRLRRLCRMPCRWSLGFTSPAGVSAAQWGPLQSTSTPVTVAGLATDTPGHLITGAPHVALPGPGPSPVLIVSASRCRAANVAHVVLARRHPSADLHHGGGYPGSTVPQPTVRAPPPPPPDAPPPPHSPLAMHPSPPRAYMPPYGDLGSDMYGAQAGAHGHYGYQPPPEHHHAADVQTSPPHSPPLPAPEPEFVAPGSGVPPLHPIRQAAQAGEAVRAVMGDVLVSFEPPGNCPDPAAAPTSTGWAQRYSAGDSLVTHFASYCGIDLRNPAMFVRQGNHDINVEHAFRCCRPSLAAALAAWADLSHRGLALRCPSDSSGSCS